MPCQVQQSPRADSMDAPIKDMILAIVGELDAATGSTHPPFVSLKKLIQDQPADAITAYLDGPMAQHTAPITQGNVEYFFAEGHDDPHLLALELSLVKDKLDPEMLKRSLNGLSQAMMLQKTAAFLPPGLMDGIQKAASQVIDASSGGEVDTDALARVTGELLGQMGMGGPASAQPEDRVARIKDARKKLI